MASGEAFPTPYQQSIGNASPDAVLLMFVPMLCILASVVDTREPGVSLSSKPVGREYPNVLSDELSELPPPRGIDFAIELEADIIPISRAPYRMTLAKLKEPKGELNVVPLKNYENLTSLYLSKLSKLEKLPECW
ncbi:gag protease polyprotein [Cucumis melo var. makuwa]|uniref:Gag protease polyprotein n=1 Tax=Cucumis melo var. makuwa TaxID=1194695 RepID=A0A5A7T5S1_CUCMM|nr:gag protease polyprotein [Cucumis melo var. makuwa]TYK01971.1 gag protease polyprotein [Cucumis melo var. makuwa]